jgi:copper(I)-binding protein
MNLLRTTPPAGRHRLAAAAALALGFALGAATVFAPATAHAQTTVKDAWIRSTVPQQKATGLFAEIVSAQGGKLVSVSTPAAGLVEIHEMKMDGDVMRMRAIDGLALPAGKPVMLAPGGYHVMLMDLKQPLAAGAQVPVTLVVEGAGGQRETVNVTASVRAMTGAAMPAGGGHGAGHKH